MTALLVCSGGGHLKQLAALVRRMGIPPDEQTWATFDNPLSRSLLDGLDVVYVPFAGPRDLPNILRVRLAAARLLARRRFDVVVSTGSSPAVAFLPPAARKGAEAFYIESAARAVGPSLSGRIVARNPRITTYTQYPAWADERWRYGGSIFDEYRSDRARGRCAPVRRAVVSVGTQEGYRFDRLLRAAAGLLADCDEVLWQTGPQDAGEFGISGARAGVPHAELSAAVAEADVVIAHSGTGAALTALEHGKYPILLPRLAKHHEHVDDHQLQIAGELERRDLALVRQPEELTADDLAVAASRRTRRIAAPAFELGAVA